MNRPGHVLQQTDQITRRARRSILVMEQALKRKSPGSGAEEPTAVAEQPRAETPPLKKTRTDPPKPMAHLDITKPTLVVKQKPIELAEVSNQIKKTLVAATEELESCTAQIQQLTPSQTDLIACLVHESDKPLPELTRYVRSKLLPQTTLLIDDEPSQKPFDPLPPCVIEAAINQAAQRINYAPGQADLDWLPASLPKGFQVWRWEAIHQESVIPADLKEIAQKRWAERQLIKPQICTILSGLNSSERETLLRKLNPGKRKPAKNNTDASTPKSTQPSKPKIRDNSQDVVCLGSSPTRSKPHVAEQEIGEKALTEKEIIKRQKEQKRKEKEDAKLAAEREKKKMGSLMSGWMTKANNAPKTVTKKNNTLNSEDQDQVHSTAHVKNGTPVHPCNKKLTSDFDKTFKPFHLKPHAQLAPINRFRSNHRPHSESDQLEPFESLTHAECLDQFVKLIRSKGTNCGASSSSNHNNNNSKNKKITTVREIINGIAESELTGCIDGSKKWRRALQNRSIIPVKILRFHEDVRPGYIGTWCKTSRLVSGRNPFGKDTCLLDYDYDSEADWNEEDGEGEDLEQSDGGREDGGEGSELTDSDEDGWLVGDDDEIERVDDAQIHASNRAHDFEFDDQFNKSNKKITGLARRKVVGPLIPVIKGPIWEESLGVVPNNMFESFRIQMINDAPLGLNPFVYQHKTILKANRPKLSTVGFKPSPAILPLPKISNEKEKQSTDLTKVVTTRDQQEENVKENETNKQQEEEEKKLIKENGKKNKIDMNQINNFNFPKELIPDMVKLVNGNKKSKPVLIDEIKNFCNLHFSTVKVSKKSIEKLLNLFAVKVSGTWRIIVEPNSSSFTSTSSIS